MTFPDDSIQSILDPSTPWWVKTESKSVDRGSLVKAFLPHVDQIPFTIIPKGRKEHNVHDRAYVQIRKLDIKRPNTKADLPVAAMSSNEKEIWAAYRAKMRPCLIIGKSRNKVDNQARRDMPHRNTASTLLVVPFYGADQEGRGGYNPELVQLIRHVRYPQFYVDMLPLSGSNESIGRFDQIQPVGHIYNSYKHTGYKLSDDALSIIDELFQYYLHDLVVEGGDLDEFLNLINEVFYS